MKIVTADEMREIDRRTIKDYGIPGAVLMENAGRGATDAIEEFISKNEIENVLIVAGKGNNGGDGFVVARHLANRGLDCEICLIGLRDDISGDAKVNLDAAVKMGIEVRELSDDISLLDDLVPGPGLIVDAIFGTGLGKEVEGFHKEVIEAVNLSGLSVISLDIPSGLDATSGRPLGVAIEADMTVTFCLPKTGSVIYPGADYVGELVLAAIGAPYELLESDDLKTSLIIEDDVADILLPRDADSQKGTYGHLLIVAGSIGKSGAAAMAGEGAMRSGSGLVTIACPASINNVLEVKLSEVMTEPLTSSEEGFLDEGNLDAVLQLLKEKSALVLGPGISRKTPTGKLVRSLVKELTIPAAIDADALWHLADDLDMIKKCKAPLILTPHPGEMARLLGISTKEVQEDRIGLSRKFSEEYGCWLVLKGARTVIAAPDGNVYINTTGNPGMATAGTGDVLSGMIGSFLGQGCTPLESAMLGVYLHGYAGDLAAEEKGETSLIATDIIGKIPEVMKEFAS